MKIYEAPMAWLVHFEAVNIIATSDTPDLLIRWGMLVQDFDSESIAAEQVNHDGLNFYD